MPRQLIQVMRQVRRLVDPRPAEDASDAQLLERFSQRREERAFEALLERYGPLVFGLCGRLLRHEQDTQDAFQATFLVLAQKAGSIRRYESVGSWLYGVAFRVAGQAKRAAARRRLHERPVGDEEVLPAPDSASDPAEEAARRDLDAALDEEVLRLPAKYRLPIILCCLQGKSNEEAARELGWPKGTVQGRLARARECLRGRLERRGAALGLGVLVSAAPVPATLADCTLQAAGLFAEGTSLPAGVTGNAVVLSQGVLRTMFLAKLKMVFLLLVAAGGIAGGSGAVTYRMTAAPVEVARAAAPLAPEDAADQQALVNVASPFEGIVQTVVVKVGSKVRKGEVLVRLDSWLAESEGVLQKAKVASAEAELQSALATMGLRRQQWLRTDQVRKQNGVTQEEVDIAKVAFETSEAAVTGKKQAVKIAMVELGRAQTLLKMHTIRCPVEGVVKALPKKPGEAVKRLETAVVIRATKDSD